jgi:mannose-6-phosphate isomerase-like protein (cupin superfamily)
MTEPVMLAPGAGHTISGVGATVKVTGEQGAYTSTFESVVPPGYDVGAHVHHRGQEMFYVLSGELDVLAFEPVSREPADWHDWEAPDGRRFLRGGPGAFMWVPENTPHAFANRTDEPVRVFFQSSVPGGHENYFAELAALLAAEGPPDQAAVVDLRQRYDIEQITDLGT